MSDGKDGQIRVSRDGQAVWEDPAKEEAQVREGSIEIPAWEFIDYVKLQIKKRPHLKLHSIVVSDPEGESSYRLSLLDE